MDKEEALDILEEVKDNVNVCCAITMEPDEVLELIEKLEEFIQNSK
tara:strand:+ start:51 stop:188 length:138 start_codon:yes stop_codon:yes gene_type:complete